MKCPDYSIFDTKWFQHKPIQYLFSLFYRQGFELRIVGGAIRNHIMGRPVNDIDFATDALPDQVIDIAHSHGFSTYKMGKEHGTIGIIMDRKHAYEITTLRQDIITNGRHAIVKFGTSWYSDAQRRDFTFNALYADKYGQVYDYLQGVSFADCRLGFVRFIGNPRTRIQEDFLRVFRYFRFLSLYSQQDPDTDIVEIMRNHKNEINAIARERVRHELNATLLSHPRRLCDIFKVIYDLELLKEHGFDTFCKTRFENEFFIRSQESFFRLWMLFYCCKNESDIANYHKKNTLSKKEKKRVRLLIKGQQNYCNLSDDTYIYNLINVFGVKNVQEIILGACVSHNVDYTEYQKYLSVVESLSIQKFPLKAFDLIQVGFKQGKALGDILFFLRHIWVQSEYNLEKEQLIAQALKKYHYEFTKTS